MRETAPTVYVTLTGNIMNSTEKAILLEVLQISGTPTAKSRTLWFPKSQCSKMFKDPVDLDKDFICVAEWICKEKELI